MKGFHIYIYIYIFVIQWEGGEEGERVVRTVIVVIFY